MKRDYDIAIIGNGLMARTRRKPGRYGQPFGPTPAQTFQAETNAEIARGREAGLREAQRQDAATCVVEKKTAVDRYQRKVEILCREMLEDLSESEVLEILMRGIVRECKSRAVEAGSWNAQELHARASVLEHAADEMLERVCVELGAI